MTLLSAARTARLSTVAGLALSVLASTLAVTAPAASARNGATIESFTDCVGGYGPADGYSGGRYAGGSGWDEAGRTYLACGSTVRIYSATGNLHRSVPLPFIAEDVAPSPDGSAFYVARWDASPARMELQGDGGYRHDAAWAPQPYSLYGKTFTPKGHWLATDAAGNLYLADGAWTSNRTHTVLKYAADGQLLTRFGEWANTWSTGTFFHQLNGVSVSRDGSEVVTVEGGNDRLQRWGLQADGSYAVTSTFGSNEQNHADRQGDSCNVAGWSGEFAAPHDTGFDGAGNFYVLNTTCREVDKFSPTGAFLQSFDLRHADAAFPHGFAVARNGDVFVPAAERVIRTKATDGEYVRPPGAPEVPIQACSRYAAPNGKDTNPGTAASPVLTLNRLTSVLQPGQTGCLEDDSEIVLPATGGTGIMLGGSAGQPKIVRPRTPGKRATVRGLGKFLVAATQSDLILKDIDIRGADDLGGGNLFHVNGDRVMLDGVDISWPRNICLGVGAASGEFAEDFVLIDSRIHDCGTTHVNDPGDPGGAHGAYLQFVRDSVTDDDSWGAIVYNTLFDHNDARGLQLYPDADRVLVDHAVMYGNGANLNMGADSTAVRSEGNLVRNTVLANSRLDFDAPSNPNPTSTNDVVGYFPSGSHDGADNRIVDSCLSNTVRPGRLFAVTNNGNSLVLDRVTQNQPPTFVDVEARDFRLATGSTCPGMGLADASRLPAGPTTGPSDPAEPAAPTLSLAPAVISAGQATTVTYRGAPGSTVDILSRTQPATVFSKIGTVVLDGNGVGTSIHKPQKNTRVTARTSTGAMSEYAPLVAVRSVASLNASRIGTRTYTFTGRVYPALDNRLVNVYRNGALVAQARSDATGIYKVTRTLGAGTFTFQARTPDDQSNLGTSSAPRSVRIH